MKAGTTGVSVTFNAVLELYAGKLARTVLRGPRFREETWLPNYPTDPTQHVSHETIYTAIYAQPRGELRRQLIACLRHGHSTRMSRTRGTDRRGQIPDMVSIHVRPPEIEDRLLPGHWEGDFIKGAGNQSSVGVLVERTSRLVLLAKMEDATAASALAGFLPNSTRLQHRCDKLLPTTREKKCRGIKNSQQPLACACTSATHIAPGSAGPAKTPTDCSVNICLRAPTSRSTPRTSSMPSPTV